MASTESSPLFERSGWRIVRFDDVVENVNVHEREPIENGLSRFVGLEHLSPDTLKIASWGEIAGGTSFTKKFVAGQVLFPKRRVYQRKFAYADFDGLCSGDLLVFQPKTDALVPELLPFLVQTESFISHALATSAGSLSPRTKWRDLADFEFALPTRTTQVHLAELLWTMVNVTDRYDAVIRRTQAARRALVSAALEGFRQTSKHVALRDLGDVRLGRQRAPKYSTGKHPRPYLRVLNVGDGRLHLDDVAEMDFEPSDFERYRLESGDVLVTEGDITSPYNVGRSAVYRGEIEGCCYQNTLIRFRPFADLDPEFVNAALQDLRYRGRFAAVASTTTVSHLGGGRFSQMKIPVPPREEQNRFAGDLALVESAIDCARTSASRIRGMGRVIRERFLGAGA